MFFFVTLAFYVDLQLVRLNDVKKIDAVVKKKMH